MTDCRQQKSEQFQVIFIQASLPCQIGINEVVLADSLSSKSKQRLERVFLIGQTDVMNEY